MRTFTLFMNLAVFTLAFAAVAYDTWEQTWDGKWLRSLGSEAALVALGFVAALAGVVASLSIFRKHRLLRNGCLALLAFLWIVRMGDLATLRNRPGTLMLCLVMTFMTWTALFTPDPRGGAEVRRIPGAFWGNSHP